MVVRGKVTLAGAVLLPSERPSWVHAPRSHALPILRCVDDATIRLEPHPAAEALHGLGSLSPLFSRLWHEDKAEADDAAPTTQAHQTFQILYTPDNGPKGPTQHLTVPPEWNKLISELTEAKAHDARGNARRRRRPSLFVCGPKSSGKSTLSRLLANRLLTDSSKRGKALPSGVAVLDIDPGQPEYGTPGSLSLVIVHRPNLAPPFCHPHSSHAGDRELVRAHELASLSPASNPEHFIECVMDLHSLYQRDLRHRFPLVINTPGWVLGAGLDLLVELIGKIQPSNVIYMSEEGPEETVQGLKEACREMPLTQLPSQPGTLRSKTPTHLRAMQVMSYFHLDFAQSRHDTGLRWNTTPLTAIRPWLVPYTGPESGILGVMCYDYQPPLELLADAINGTVLSIVAVESTAAFRTKEDGSAITADSLPPDRKTLVIRSPEGIPCIWNPCESTLDPRYSYKLGSALVRGIDTESKMLQLLTPLETDAIINAVLQEDGLGVVLISGKLDLPTWAYTEDLHLQNGARRSGADDSKGDQEKDADEDADEDTDEDATDQPSDSSTGDDGEYTPASGSSEVPWVETIQRWQKRLAGSRVWRVRRDLGRNSGAGSAD